MAVRECIGGPHDGRNASAIREPWAFVNGDGRCFRRPGHGRALYRNLGECWAFVGHHLHVCAGCGALIPPGACPLCGAKGDAAK